MREDEFNKVKVTNEGRNFGFEFTNAQKTEYSFQAENSYKSVSDEKREKASNEDHEVKQERNESRSSDSSKEKENEQIKEEMMNGSESSSSSSDSSSLSSSSSGSASSSSSAASASSSASAVSSAVATAASVLTVATVATAAGFEVIRNKPTCTFQELNIFTDRVEYALVIQNNDSEADAFNITVSSDSYSESNKLIGGKNTGEFTGLESGQSYRILVQEEGDNGETLYDKEFTTTDEKKEEPPAYSSEVTAFTLFNDINYQNYEFRMRITYTDEANIFSDFQLYMQDLDDANAGERVFSLEKTTGMQYVSLKIDNEIVINPDHRLKYEMSYFDSSKNERVVYKTNTNFHFQESYAYISKFSINSRAAISDPAFTVNTIIDNDGALSDFELYMEDLTIKQAKEEMPEEYPLDYQHTFSFDISNGTQQVKFQDEEAGYEFRPEDTFKYELSYKRHGVKVVHESSESFTFDNAAFNDFFIHPTLTSDYVMTYNLYYDGEQSQIDSLTLAFYDTNGNVVSGLEALSLNIGESGADLTFGFTYFDEAVKEVLLSQTLVPHLFGGIAYKDGSYDRIDRDFEPVTFALENSSEVTAFTLFNDINYQNYEFRMRITYTDEANIFSDFQLYMQDLDDADAGERVFSLEKTTGMQYVSLKIDNEIVINPDHRLKYEMSYFDSSKNERVVYKTNTNFHFQESYAYISKFSINSRAAISDPAFTVNTIIDNDGALSDFELYMEDLTIKQAKEEMPEEYPLDYQHTFSFDISNGTQQVKFQDEEAGYEFRPEDTFKYELSYRRHGVKVVYESSESFTFDNAAFNDFIIHPTLTSDYVMTYNLYYGGEQSQIDSLTLAFFDTNGNVVSGLEALSLNIGESGADLTYGFTYFSEAVKETLLSQTLVPHLYGGIIYKDGSSDSIDRDFEPVTLRLPDSLSISMDSECYITNTSFNAILNMSNDEGTYDNASPVIVLMREDGQKTFRISTSLEDWDGTNRALSISDSVSMSDLVDKNYAIYVVDANDSDAVLWTRPDPVTFRQGQSTDFLHGFSNQEFLVSEYDGSQVMNISLDMRNNSNPPTYEELFVTFTPVNGTAGSPFTVNVVATSDAQQVNLDEYYQSIRFGIEYNWVIGGSVYNGEEYNPVDSIVASSDPIVFTDNSSSGSDATGTFNDLETDWVIDENHIMQLTLNYEEDGEYFDSFRLHLYPQEGGSDYEIVIPEKTTSLQNIDMYYNNPYTELFGTTDFTVCVTADTPDETQAMLKEYTNVHFTDRGQQHAEPTFESFSSDFTINSNNWITVNLAYDDMYGDYQYFIMNIKDVNTNGETLNKDITIQNPEVGDNTVDLSAWLLDDEINNILLNEDYTFIISMRAVTNAGEEDVGTPIQNQTFTRSN